MAGLSFRCKNAGTNTLIYLHTDLGGIYGRGASIHGRFRGWLLADAEGPMSLRPSSQHLIRPAGPRPTFI